MTKATARTIRVTGVILFIIYLLFLFYFLFFAESYGRTADVVSYRYNLEPFKEIRRFIRYHQELGRTAVWLNIGGNILAFVPFGCILPVLWRRLRSWWRVFVLSMEFSAVIECIQLVFRVGSFDVDDIILNTLGGFLGYLLFAVCNWLRRKYYG